MTAKILTLIIILIAMAYAHHNIRAALDYTYEPPAGWVAEDRVERAMNHMGPRYPYMMVGETLYVDSGRGWLRLRY